MIECIWNKRIKVTLNFEVSVTYNGLMRIRFIRRTKLIFAETLGIEQR